MSENKSRHFIQQMIDADLLILLSDVDGLYNSNPNKNKNAQKINEVYKIDKQIEQISKKQTSSAPELE